MARIEHLLSLITDILDLAKGESSILELRPGSIKAVELAHRLQAALIVMDIQMPGCDGLETIRINHKEKLQRALAQQKHP